MLRYCIIILLLSPLLAHSQKVTDTDINTLFQLSGQGKAKEVAEMADSLLKKVTIKDSNYVVLISIAIMENEKLYNIQKTIFLVEEFLQIVPDKEGENLLYLGLLKKKLGDFEGAINAYLKVIQINPKEEIVYNNLANTYNASGNYKEAIQTLQSNPNKENLSLEYYQFAYAYFKLKQLDSAKLYIDRYLTLEESATDFIAHKTAALIYLSIQDTAKACESIKKSLLIIKKNNIETELNNQPEKSKDTYQFKNSLKEIEETKTLAIKICG